MNTLSESGLALFRLYVERMGKIEVDDSNREPYRELERAELVPLGRPFTGEPRYHLTRAGYDVNGGGKVQRGSTFSIMASSVWLTRWIPICRW